ncbi:16570_t:CDS:2, partial [Dentiscutata erythropus]
IQHNGNYLLIATYEESIVEYEEEYKIENNNEQELQNVYSNFKPLEKMIDDIETLENQHIMLKTFKDFNRNTLYWD